MAEGTVATWLVCLLAGHLPTRRGAHKDVTTAPQSFNKTSRDVDHKQPSNKSRNLNRKQPQPHLSNLATHRMAKLPINQPAKLSTDKPAALAIWQSVYYIKRLRSHATQNLSQTISQQQFNNTGRNAFLSFAFA